MTKNRKVISAARTAGVLLMRDFATPIAFFITFRQAGAKPAIALALVVTAIQVFYHRIQGIKFSPFFIVASGFTTLFGGIDLLIDQPRYFRLEPFAQNFVMGLIFSVTVVFRVPIASWFAGALPEQVRPDLDLLSPSYMRNLTLVWAAYFFAKSFVFLYLALTVNLGELIILRSIIGSGSLALLFMGEIFYRRRKYPAHRHRKS